MDIYIQQRNFAIRKLETLAKDIHKVENTKIETEIALDKYNYSIDLFFNLKLISKSEVEKWEVYYNG